MGEEEETFQSEESKVMEAEDYHEAVATSRLNMTRDKSAEVSATSKGTSVGGSIATTNASISKS